MASFIAKQMVGNQLKSVKGAIGGDEKKGADAADDEEDPEVAEARREAEEKRKEKHRKMEEEREGLRQSIRDKYGLKKKVPEEENAMQQQEDAGRIGRKKKTPAEFAAEASVDKDDDDFAMGGVSGYRSPVVHKKRTREAGVDNSDYMRNGDFVPTRLQAQQDAVNLVCHSKTRSNPENNVGLIVMSNVEVLTTLTADVGRILSKLHQVQPKGNIQFCTAVKVAHLALKHRQGKNHRMRIVVFVGSPIEDDEKEVVKLSKKLKKEKVNVDIINFGEEGLNTEKLTEFVNTINGKDGTGSHLVTVPPGPLLSEALVNSPVIVGEDGAGVAMQATGFEFGIDPNEDPELALALRVSMEEQRARQEEEARKVQTESVADSAAMSGIASTEPCNEEALLEQAISMSMGQNQTPSVPDFSSMSEEDQIAYALQMSLQNSADNSISNTPAPMDTDDRLGSSVDPEKGDEDYSEVMNDPDFLQQVLESLPGVDPNSEAIQNAMSSLTRDHGKLDGDKKDSDKKSDKK